LKQLTVVSFHAHPDDEALLTGGTLAMLAAAGHRVVLVVATAGAQGLSGETLDPDGLARRRLEELDRSATALGCARVVHLGFADSGWSPDGATAPAEGTFATVPVAEAARRLADVLQEENADLLTVYDRNGGYGHLDHVRVHDVGLAAAELAGTPRVLEATLDRTLLRRVMRGLGLVRLVPSGTAVDRVDSWFSARNDITHRVPVGAFAAQKRAALASHATQASGGDGPRTAALLLRLPAPLFRRVCGTEWFIETGAPVPHPPIADPLESAMPARVLP
jgi:LmbE family N-acetylglucosaminyl deacetylase